MLSQYLLVCAGFVLLLGGGEALVRGAVHVARRFGLSELVVGLTVVALGTSAPELVVAIASASGGSPEIAVGNVIGSNICNIALVLGLSGLVKPIVVDRDDIRPDAWAMLASAFVLVLLGVAGGVTRLTGLVLVSVLVAYVALSYRRERASGAEARDWHAEEVRAVEADIGMPVALLLVAVGASALVLGAEWLVDGAVAIAGAWGVPRSVIALTVVAVGTSLPELATSIVAAVRGHPDVAVGNVLGSSVFNVLSILGITAIVAPIPIDGRLMMVDLAVLVLASMLVVGLLVWRGGVGRVAGAGLLVGYLAYVVSLFAV